VEIVAARRRDDRWRREKWVGIRGARKRSSSVSAVTVMVVVVMEVVAGVLARGRRITQWEHDCLWRMMVTLNSRRESEERF